MSRGAKHQRRVHVVVIASLAANLFFHMSLLPGVQARDLLPPKEQKDTSFEETTGPSFDVQKRGVPQSIFVSIQMARGYEVEWDSFGRQGWYTQDPPH